MRYVPYVWRVVVGLIYLAVVIGILSIATTRFETVVLAGMVQLYAAVLYNFSVIGVATDVNNYAAFVRFRILATAQGNHRERGWHFSGARGSTSCTIENGQPCNLYAPFV